MQRSKRRRQHRNTISRAANLVAVPGNFIRRRRVLLEQLESRYALDNTPAAAIDLGEILTPKTAEGRVAVDDPQDYYHFSVTQPQNLRFQLTELTADADVTVYRDNAGTLEFFRTSRYIGTESEYILERDVPAGSYYILVKQASGNTDYTLSVTPLIAPVVLPQTFYVDANTPQGTIFDKVVVDDADSPTHSFSMFGDPSGSPVIVYSDGNVFVANAAALKPGTVHTLYIRVSDDTYLWVDSTLTFIVTGDTENLPPTISDIADQNMPANGSLTVTYGVGDDAGPEALTISVASNNSLLFPAGSIVMSGNGATRTLKLTPAANQTGKASFSVVVQDGEGESVTETFEITVLPVIDLVGLETPSLVQILPDPENPGHGLLVVNGTNKLDFISINPLGTKTLVQTNFAGTSSFNNADFDRIVINSFEGSDRILLSPLLAKPATINSGSGDDLVLSGKGSDVINAGAGFDMVFGRDGNDFIFGEAGIDFLYGKGGNDVLIGGAGTDTLSGGAGNDVLNGGGDFDTLLGDGGDDLLIGGNFTHATSLSELQTIQAIWTASNPFATRITNLASRVNPQTVTNDNKVDWIFGGQGRDWIVDYAFFDLVLDLNFNPTNGDKWNNL